MSRRGSRRDPVKERFWRDTLQRQEASGLSVREFCARHSLAETAFYSWRAEIQRRNQESGRSAIRSQRESRVRAMKAASLKAKAASPAGRPKFLPVAVTNVATASFVEIALPSGVLVRVGGDCDRQTLRTVLGAVLRNKAEAPAC
jgi:hypothetical protein